MGKTLSNKTNDQFLTESQSKNNNLFYIFLVKTKDHLKTKKKNT